MKKWIFVIAVFAMIVLIGQKWQGQNERNSEIEYQVPGIEIKLSDRDIYTGKLLLINGDHRMQSTSVMGDLTTQGTDQTENYAMSHSSITLSAEVLEQLEKMIEDARSEGLDKFILTSGYRSEDEQQEQYEQLGSRLALPPGYSEHQSGLAVDISSQVMKMEAAPEGAWLAKHSAEYGFILRYPKGKEHITGVDYEPWHYRYVGLPHSIFMKKQGLTLEEYIEKLREVSELSINFDGKHYIVSYYEVPPQLEMSIWLDEEMNHEVSGNNVDGVIITSWKEK